jgi:pyruvate dehydrogenase E2 component (dihydrolipoamide acetyltransferase)
MATDVVMPRLSDSMEEGTILAWHKQVGDSVDVGDDLVEIETDKANMSYESDTQGTLLAVFAEEGEILSVGALIARIGAAGEQSDHDSAVGSEEFVRPGPLTEATDRDRPRAEVKASPLARRLAKELGVDLVQLAEAEPSKRITRSDVERAASEQTGGLSPTPPSSLETAKGQTEVVQLTRRQELVARRMSESKSTAPHFYLQSEVDMSAAVAARRALNDLIDEGAPRPSINDLVIKACALALREFPKVNGAFKDGHLELYPRINVGFAVAAGEALVVPVIHDVDRKGLAAIASESRGLAAKVREDLVTPPELAGGTFSISNLGMFGVTSFQAVLNPPQAAILAVGAIEERPALRAGELVSAPVMSLTLSADHRILNGADGAAFLGRVRKLLETPLGLAL